MATFLDAIKRDRGKFKNISIGIVILAIQLFIIVNVESVYPENTEFFRGVLTTYLGMLALIFAVPDLRSKLLDIPFLKGFKKLAIFTLAPFAFFFILSLVISNGAYESVARNLQSVSAGVLLLQAFYVSVVEEIAFRDFFQSRIGIIPAVILFSLFHWTIWGGNLILLLFGVVLGFVFSYVKFRWSPKDNLANIGFHFAYNMFIIGLLIP